MNVYDFDKTIYAGDSTLDFYIYCLKKYPRIIFCLPRQLGAALLFYLGIYSKVRYKETFYTFLRYLNDMDKTTEDFWKENKSKIRYCCFM
jgi:hypothetical protein